MATIVNNPGENNSTTALLVGIVIAALLAIVFFVFALPALRNSSNQQSPNANTPNNTQQNLPAGDTNNYKFNLKGGVQTPPSSGGTP